MSKLKTNTIQHTGGSADNITLDNSQNVTAEGNLTVDGNLTVSGTSTISGYHPTTSRSNRNLIINGAMQVNQRTSTSGLDDFNVVTGNLYTLDRWQGVGTSSFDWDSARIKQVSDSPDEFSNSLRVDIGNTETPGAGQNGLVRTKIEAQDLQHLAYGTSSAKTCTLSFWVRSNKTGTYCVQIQQRDADKHLLYEYSISSANTWEKKTITFSGNTSDAITNDNGIGFQIALHLACHSDDHESATTSWAANSGGSLKATSNQVNLWDHADNVWYITGVQLEVGSVATDFEHRSYGDELARCKRYYHHWVDSWTAEKTLGMIWASYDSTGAHGTLKIDPQMRDIPTLKVANATNAWTYIDGTSDDFDTIAANSTGRWTNQTVELYASGNLSTTTGRAAFVRCKASPDTTYIAFDAEL